MECRKGGFRVIPPLNEVEGTNQSHPFRYLKTYWTTPRKVDRKSEMGRKGGLVIHMGSDRGFIDTIFGLVASHTGF